MTLDKRELEIISTVLATYTSIAAMVDQRLHDEVVFLRNKLQELQDSMKYEGYSMLDFKGADYRPFEVSGFYVADVV